MIELLKDVSIINLLSNIHTLPFNVIQRIINSTVTRKSTGTGTAVLSPEEVLVLQYLLKN